MTDHTIPGEFTRVVIAQGEPAAQHVPVRRVQPFTVNPLETAHRRLIVELATILLNKKVPRIEDTEAARDYERQVAEILDHWHLELGRELKSVAVSNPDMKWFTNQFVAAIDGNSSFCFDMEIEAIRAEHDEVLPAVRAGRTASAIISMIKTERGL